MCEGLMGEALIHSMVTERPIPICFSISLQLFPHSQSAGSSSPGNSLVFRTLFEMLAAFDAMVGRYGGFLFVTSRVG